MHTAEPWITERGYHSERAGWLPSLLLSGAAIVLTVFPWLLLFAGLDYYGSSYGSFFSLRTQILALSYLLIALAWVLRRHYPAVMLVLAVTACLIQVALGAPAPPVLVPFIVYDYARWTQRYSRLAVAAGLIGSVIGPAVWMTSGYWNAPFFSLPVYLVLVVGCAGLVVAPYVIARFFRAAADRDAERQLRETERLRQEAAVRAQQARAAEAGVRNQIARELHDIVAHSLSVIVVQAEGGRALADRRPEAAAAVLNTIADTSREALGEMRRIVGVLRDGPDAAGAADYLPAPTLAEIPDMVARAGERFRYREEGSPPGNAPAALQLTAYRVVQEAVTNVLKHAGAEAGAEIFVNYLPHGIELSIVDNGRGSAAPDDQRGHGLRGMAERVTSMGGQLDARPGPTGGFAVRAYLPLSEQPVAQPPATPQPRPYATYGARR